MTNQGKPALLTIITCPPTANDYLVVHSISLDGKLAVINDGTQLPVYGSDITSLSLTVDFETSSRLRIRIRDATQKRYTTHIT
jgi:hypothetical protein